MPHVSEVGNKEGTAGLGGGQTTPDFGGFAHGSTLFRGACCPATKPQSCLAGHCSGRHFRAPVCVDCLGSESASGQTALRVAPVAALRMAPHRSSLNMEGDPALALVPKALRRGSLEGA